MGRTRAKAKRRERPLGAAVGLGVLTAFGVGLLILIVELLIPNSTLHNFYLLAHHNASATLPLDPLYQEWADKIQEEDALLVTPLSLLCGGLVMGRLSPSYVPRRRLLIAGGLLGLGVLAVSLGFLWPTAILQQNTLNAHEGGQIVHLTAPVGLIVRQALFGAAWTALCVLGTRLGLHWRDRHPTMA